MRPVEGRDTPALWRGVQRLQLESHGRTKPALSHMLPKNMTPSGFITGAFFTFSKLHKKHFRTPFCCNPLLPI